MKKSIVALAVLASMAAQAHNTTLYGSIRMAYDYDDASESSIFTNAGSRFGIRGEDDLGNGLTSFYQYENRVRGNLDTEYLYLGLKGGFGSLSFGLQDLPTDMLDDESDPFNRLGAGLQAGDGSLYDEALPVLGTSSNNSMVYMSPDMSGFQVGVGLVADGASGEDHIDGFDIAAKYAANGLYAGVGYNYSEISETAAITVAAGYANDMFAVGLAAEVYDVDGVDNDPVWVRLGGTYNMTEADSIYASGSVFDYDVSGADSSYQVGLGYQHKFSPRTRAWAEYTYTDLDNGAGDVNAISLGLRTDF